jgi:hypothetical protein
MPIFPPLEKRDETETGSLALGLEPNHENRTMDPKSPQRGFISIYI